MWKTVAAAAAAAKPAQEEKAGALVKKDSEEERRAAQSKLETELAPPAQSQQLLAGTQVHLNKVG